MGVVGFLGWGFLISGVPGIEVIKVSFDEDASDTCQLKSLGDSEKLKGSDQDILVLRLANDCDDDHTVEIANNAPVVCVGEPYGVKMDADFPIKGHSKAYLLCTVNKAPYGEYKLGVVLRAMAAGDALGIRVSELALEEVP